MKKIVLILFGLILTNTATFGFDAGMGNSTFMNPAMGGLGSTPAHDMQMINDIKQRYEIYNDVKANKQERIRKLDEAKFAQPTPKKLHTETPSQQNIQFVEENGKLKIQSIQ